MMRRVATCHVNLATVAKLCQSLAHADIHPGPGQVDHVTSIRTELHLRHHVTEVHRRPPTGLRRGALFCRRSAYAVLVQPCLKHQYVP